MTPNFHLSEFTDSQTAARLGIDNTPSDAIVTNLKATAEGMEEVRKYLGGKPIIISSGYRSPSLNAAVGGTMGSSHLLGQAVDFTCPAFGTPQQIVTALIESDIQFDTVILEFQRWVHIAFNERKRRRALIIDKSGTRGFTS